eukprot:15432140-Alexandrium_andersonii.AAC.1
MGKVRGRVAVALGSGLQIATDKRLALDVVGLRERLATPGDFLRRVPSGAMLTDGLTKGMASPDALQAALSEGRWSLTRNAEAEQKLARI